MELFFTYYGPDWLSSVVGLVGLYLVTEKKRVGFLLTIFSVCLAGVVAVMAGQYGFLVANTATFILAARGYIKWIK